MTIHNAEKQCFSTYVNAVVSFEQVSYISWGTFSLRFYHNMQVPWKVVK